MPRRTTERVTVGSHTVQVSNAGKVLFPDSRITKGEFVQYYRDVAPFMLGHVRERPLSLERFPDGLGGERFYQKEIPEYFPDFFQRVDVKPEEGEPKLYGTVVNQASLVYLANLVTIPHVWMSCVRDLRRPDRLVWDLDPMGVGFDRVALGARLLRHLLGELGLASHPMLSGSRGLHVVVFVEPDVDVDVAFRFTRDAAHFIARKIPRLFTVEYTKSRRGKKVYVDYHRNVYAQTAVAPYAVRAVEGGPVAMPVTWDDVDDERLHAQSFTIRTVMQRLDAGGESWSDGAERSALGPAMDRMAKLMRNGAL